MTEQTDQHNSRDRWDRICRTLEELIEKSEHCANECRAKGFDKLFSEISTISVRMKRMLSEMKNAGPVDGARQDGIAVTIKADDALEAVHQGIEEALKQCKDICAEFTGAETNMNITKRCSDMHEMLRKIESLVQERLKHLHVTSVY